MIWSSLHWICYSKSIYHTQIHPYQYDSRGDIVIMTFQRFFRLIMLRIHFCACNEYSSDFSKWYMLWQAKFCCPFIVSHVCLNGHFVYYMWTTFMHFSLIYYFSILSNGSTLGWLIYVHNSQEQDLCADHGHMLYGYYKLQYHK